MRKWLREKRSAQSMSERDVALRAGIAQPFYHYIEMGVKNPSVDTAKKIATVLDFDWTLFYQDGHAETEYAQKKY